MKQCVDILEEHENASESEIEGSIVTSSAWYVRFHLIPKRSAVLKQTFYVLFVYQLGLLATLIYKLYHIINIYTYINVYIYSRFLEEQFIRILAGILV